MNLVVFLPSLIGDTVMATPTLRALRKGFPSGRLTVVSRPNVAPVLDGLDWFDQVIHFHPRSKVAEQRTPALIRRLRANRPDAAVLLPNSIRTAWISRLAGIGRRVGYDRYLRGWLLTDRLQPPRDAHGKLLPCPIVEYYLATARALGCHGDGVRLQLATTTADETAADEALAALGVDASNGLVCLNTGGAFGPAKAWPVESFGRLARRLAEESGVAVVALCGPSEREESRRIAELAAHPRVVSLADQKLSLGLSKAMVKRADLLVTTDSGPRHFAAAFGTPVVSLFGPTRIEWTRTNQPNAIHLFHPVPCGPCQRPVCPQGHHLCMKQLTPESVFSASQRLLLKRTDLRTTAEDSTWRPG
ncbi:lipopolysaccharide heptosyltransferase II [Paludisphaera rhizosphaerae]|uniref:lipopolysaccharide heptosyltransferase II n=1 Tax=Paludisphaera rhizosphaerae TaxID=2711216 RepID=UPI0013EBEC60|nr:lipopolysaccharide heptosyltransferase II [Paludisphaera rhizosphaerae]